MISPVRFINQLSHSIAYALKSPGIILVEPSSLRSNIGLSNINYYRVIVALGST